MRIPDCRGACRQTYSTHACMYVQQQLRLVGQQLVAAQISQVARRQTCSTHVCMCVCVYVCRYVCMYVYTYICICTKHLYVCVVYVPNTCMYVCVCVCACVHIYQRCSRARFSLAHQYGAISLGVVGRGIVQRINTARLGSLGVVGRGLVQRNNRARLVQIQQGAVQFSTSIGRDQVGCTRFRCAGQFSALIGRDQFRCSRARFSLARQQVAIRLGVRGLGARVSSAH